MARRPQDPVLQARPVYVSLTAFEEVLARLARHGTPQRIDEVALGHFSASMRRQVLAGFKFLQLVDAAGRARPVLGRLMVAHGTAAWSGALAEVLRAAYAPLMQHPLEGMTAAAFERLFRATYPSTDDVTRKAVTFFISAARAAQIPLSEALLEGRRVRGPNGSRAPGPVVVAAPPGPSQQRGAGYGIGGCAGAESTSNFDRDGVRDAIAFLTDLLDQSRMTPSEQEAVWTLVKYVSRCRDFHRQAA